MTRSGWLLFGAVHIAAFLLVTGSLTLKFVGSALLLPGFLVWCYVGLFVPDHISVPVAIALIVAVNALTWKTIGTALSKVHHGALRHKSP
jgi:hypothetical protein